jgi:hypothetical protein
MRRLAMVGGTLAALALASVAFGVTSASALEWLCNGVGGSKCKTDAANLEVLLLEDSGVPAAVECAVETVVSTGTVGAGVADETITAAFVEASKNCKPAAKAFNLEDKEVANGCTAVDNVVAINLPWASRLEEATWDLLMKGSGAAGQPGYLLECMTLLGLIDDVCTVNEASTPLIKLENLIEAGVPKLVTMDFERDLLGGQASKEYPSCTDGGKEEGLIVGEILLEGLTEAGVTQALEYG